MEKEKIVLLGAGGKMGCRITRNIKECKAMEVTYVEINGDGRKRLAELGVESTDKYDALKEADTVVFAVPDILIGQISETVIPLLGAGATVVGLDPAAIYGKVMLIRDDLKYFVVHPCHPSLFPFEDNLSLEAQKDWFGGGGAAKMPLVCTQYIGTDEDYAKNEELAKKMFDPIDNSYKVTIDQMIMLEPALVESLTAPLVKGIKMATDACIAQGIPEDVVLAFVMGHLKVQFGVLFGFADFKFSDGANLALDQAMDIIFKPAWIENIMSKKAVKKSVYNITHELNKGSL